MCGWDGLLFVAGFVGVVLAGDPATFEFRPVGGLP